MAGEFQVGHSVPHAIGTSVPGSGRAALKWVIAAWVLTWASATGAGPSEAAGEYEVKAAFLYNFAKFVEWPQAAAGPIHLCIVGDDPFGNNLEEVVRGKAVSGRPIEIRRMTGGDARGCEIAFIRASTRETRSVLEALNGASTLTVGESPSFAQDGGMINFVLENKRVRFEINLGAAQRAHLKISSKLLSLARIVGSSNRAGEP